MISDVRVHNFMFVDKKIESYFSDRLTFISGRSSRHRLALPLLYPEILSPLSKLRILLYLVHLVLFVWMDDYPHKRIDKILI